MNVDIICELGLNHDGDFYKAVGMIDMAAEAGIKTVKFQKYDPIKLLGPLSPYLAYATQCQFSYKQLEGLKQICDGLGLEFLVSVFDLADIPWADSMCERHKVASRMNQNTDFMAALLMTSKPVIVSVQSSTPVTIKNVQYMFCIPEYPTSLARMDRLPCNENLGLSSHCPSIAPTLKAIAQGARLIEHHVCIDRNESGCDKTSSITFDELRQLNRFANQMVVV